MPKIDPARMAPTHLMTPIPQDAEDGPPVSQLEMRKAIDTMPTQPTSEEEARIAEKKRQQSNARWPFSFTLTTRAGKEYSGSFTSIIPNIATRGRIGVMRASLSAGLPFESLDPFTAQLNDQIATLTYMLDEKGLPEWAKNLRDLVDVEVIRALYAEVASHEATFFGPGEAS